VWGTAFVAIRVLGEVWTPWDILWFRYLPFLVVFGAWLLATQRARLRAMGGNDWIRFAVAGALGVLGYHVPLNYALREGTGVTVATAAILVTTTPLWTMLIGVLIGQESLHRRRVLGMLTAFAGTVVVVLLGRPEAELVVVKHAGLVLVAAVLWAGYNVIAKPLFARHGGLFVTGLAFCLGSLALVPVGLAAGTEPWRSVSGVHVFWALYLALLATLAGYVVWNHALSRRAASEVTSYIYAVPVVATLAGVVLIGERITPWFVLGAALVLGGVITVQRARPAPPSAPS
jgi:drug/metabolite transporter (DMT)-like permease